jgi:hypothetical protein
MGPQSSKLIHATRNDGLFPASNFFILRAFLTLNTLNRDSANSHAEFLAD